MINSSRLNDEYHYIDTAKRKLSFLEAHDAIDESFEALTWRQIGAHEKPIGLLNVKDYYVPLLAVLDHAVNEGFIFREHRASICCEADPGKMVHAMEAHQHPRAAVKRWMRQG